MKYRFVKERISNNKTIVSNFGYLTVLKFIEVFFPLITVPYLTRVLGVEKFGLVAFATAFLQYFILIVNFGFDVSATSEISIHRDNKKKVNDIFNSIMLIRFFLFIISAILFLIIVLIVPRFKEEYVLFLFAFASTIGYVLFPIWFFQGIEKMKYITYINLLTRTFFLVCVFIFIKGEGDYIYVPLLTSIGAIISGIIAILIIYKKYDIKIKVPSYNMVKEQFQLSWPIFVQRFSVNLYSNSNIFILGLLTNNTITGYFAGADKLIKAVTQLRQPISQAIFPHVAKLAKESKEQAISFLRKTVVFMGTIFLFVSFGIFLSAPYLVKWILGNEFQESILPLKIFAFLPFIISIGNMHGMQTMIPFGYRKQMMNIFTGLALFHLILFTGFCYWEHIGASISVIITEFLITISMILFLRKKGIFILPSKKLR